MARPVALLRAPATVAVYWVRGASWLPAVRTKLAIRVEGSRLAVPVGLVQQELRRQGASLRTNLFV